MSSPSPEVSPPSTPTTPTSSDTDTSKDTFSTTRKGIFYSFMIILCKSLFVVAHLYSHSFLSLKERIKIFKLDTNINLVNSLVTQPIHRYYVLKGFIPNYWVNFVGIFVVGCALDLGMIHLIVLSCFMDLVAQVGMSFEYQNYRLQFKVWFVATFCTRLLQFVYPHEISFLVAPLILSGSNLFFFWREHSVVHFDRFYLSLILQNAVYTCLNQIQSLIGVFLLSESHLGDLEILTKFGSLLMRIVFWKIEQILFHSEKENLLTLFRVFLKTYLYGILFGSLFVVDPAFAFFERRYGLAEKRVVYAYGFYVLLCSVNGISEAFHRRKCLKSGDVFAVSVGYVVMFALYCGICALLTKTHGLFGLVLANCLNMLLRIVYVWWAVGFRLEAKVVVVLLLYAVLLLLQLPSWVSLLVFGTTIVIADWGYFLCVKDIAIKKRSRAE